MDSKLFNEKSPLELLNYIREKLQNSQHSLKKIFETIDLNGDGFLTLEEF